MGAPEAFTQTTDVLKALSQARPAGQVIVGFAAETAEDADELLALGRSKLARKGCQLLVLNDVSGGRIFGSTATQITIISPDAVVARVAADKAVAAHAILDAARDVLIERKPL